MNKLLIVLLAGVFGISSIMATKRPPTIDKTQQVFSDTTPNKKPNKSDTSKWPKDTTSMPKVF